MPGISGQDTLIEMRARGFNQPVIVLTATGGIDTWSQAMQSGAVRLLREARQSPNGSSSRSATRCRWAR
jgi:FixJ family two-component response regulator